MPAAVEIVANPEWMSQRQAATAIGHSPAVVQRLALCGQIRTKAEPGCAVRYNRSDVERLVREQKGA